MKVTATKFDIYGMLLLYNFYWHTQMYKQYENTYQIKNK
jgi:hypothetical protein